MLHREKPSIQKLFWVQTPAKTWVNVVTNSVVASPPLDVQGGLVAGKKFQKIKKINSSPRR